ncbi:ComEC/Rec2 family competence protein [Frigoriglobus tundricola]|uniref:Metallo-beta-lactamase domain-containing protein n=1 Tax=Frigoriglobus tundricola TaxID=2774151 RepID=A0A6M5YVI4_9BACT|nr:hypothetical protein [Frigoriglobus tundricola]QJW97253.1 hypothetical protein FTUN_4823 [Frigoriglobus tundricola]
MLQVMIWDVDHGSAAYIKTPTGKHIAIDLGVGDMSEGGKEFSPLRHLRKHYGVERLDKLVITHPHRDHLDDIANVSLLNPRLLRAERGIKDEFINKGNKPNDKDILGAYRSLLEEYKTSVGGTPAPAVDWGCTIQHFHPVYDGPNLNNYSVVTVISYAGSKIVIPGDNEGGSWESLLKQSAFVSAIKGTDIFVASHHGRESGFYGELFDHFKPKLVIVSDTNHGSTSVTGNYTYHAEGWQVDHGRKGRVDADPRYTLTTRNDGNILIKCGTNSTTGRNYLAVSTELGAPQQKAASYRF